MKNRFRKILLAFAMTFGAFGVVASASVTPASAMLSSCSFLHNVNSASSICYAGSGLQRVVVTFHANFCNCNLTGYGNWAGLGQWSNFTTNDSTDRVVSYTRQYSG